MALTDDDGGDTSPDKGRRAPSLYKPYRWRYLVCTGSRGSRAPADLTALARTNNDAGRGLGIWIGLVASGADSSSTAGRAVLACFLSSRDAVRCEGDAMLPCRAVPAAARRLSLDEIGDMLGVGLNVLQDHGAESGVGWF